jgi:hypothetical protein
VSVDYFYARKEQKFVQAQKKTPQSFDYGVYMVARGGIEPPTQGFLAQLLDCRSNDIISF